MLKTKPTSSTTTTPAPPTVTTKVPDPKAQAQSALQANPASAKTSVPPRAPTPGSSSAAAATTVQRFVDPRPVPGASPDKNFRFNRAQLAPGAWDRIKAHGYGASMLGWMKTEGKTTGKGVRQRAFHFGEKHLGSAEHHDFKKVQRMLFAVVEGAETRALLQNGSMRYGYQQAEFDVTWIEDGVASNNHPRYRIWDARMADRAVGLAPAPADASTSKPAAADTAKPVVDEIAEEPKKADNAPPRSAKPTAPQGPLVLWQPPTPRGRHTDRGTVSIGSNPPALTLLDFCSQACLEPQKQNLLERLKVAYDQELREVVTTQEDGPPADPAAAESRALHQAKWVLNELLQNSDWGAAPRRSGDRDLRNSVEGTIGQITSDMHLFRASLDQLTLPDDVKKFLDSQFEQVIDAGSRLMTPVAATDRAAMFALIAMVGVTLSVAYPFLAGERVGQAVVLGSLAKSLYYNLWIPFRETAGGPEATIYAMYRYVGFSFVSTLLTPRLIPSAALDFTRSTAWASMVGASGAALQTYFFAGDALKKQVNRLRGKPEFPAIADLRLESDAGRQRTAQMITQFGEYFTAKARDINTARDDAKRQGLQLSPTTVAQIGAVYAKLAETAKQMQVMLKGTGAAIEDKDKRAKIGIWLAAMAQLVAPIPFAAPEPFKTYQPFILLDTIAVAIAITLQGWAKALDPSTSHDGMMEWFRQMMTFSLAKVAFFIGNWLSGNAVKSNDMALYGWAAFLALTAMTFGGLIGKGLGAGVEKMMPRRREADSGDSPDELAKQIKGLEEIYLKNPDMQSAEMTDLLMQRHVSLDTAAQQGAAGSSSLAIEGAEGSGSGSASKT